MKVASWDEIKGKIKDAYDNIEIAYETHVVSAVDKVKERPLLNTAVKMSLSAIPIIGPSLKDLYDNIRLGGAKSEEEKKAKQILEFLEKLIQQDKEQFDRIAQVLNTKSHAIIDTINQNRMTISDLISKSSAEMLKDVSSTKEYRIEYSASSARIEGVHITDVQGDVIGVGATGTGNIIGKNIGKNITVDPRQEVVEQQTKDNAPREDASSQQDTSLKAADMTDTLLSLHPDSINELTYVEDTTNRYNDPTLPGYNPNFGKKNYSNSTVEEPGRSSIVAGSEMPKDDRKIHITGSVTASPFSSGDSHGPITYSYSGSTDEKVLERYPYSRFPSKVVLESIVPLDILIKTTQTSANTAPLRVAIKQEDESEVPISVIIDPGTFEIQGENYYTTIHIPVESKDSIPVTFFLKAKEKGQQSISVRFFQQGTFLGKLTVNTLVVASRDEINDVQSQTISADWRLPRKIHPGPDITLYIIEIKHADNDVKYDVLLQSAEFPLKGLGPILFKGNPQTKFHSMFEDIENRRLPANVIENRIKAKGRTLYDEIFPKDLKDLYWDKRDKIKSIRVISQEPWIPWEIVKPYRKAHDGKMEEDPFLCERYSFSRWIKDVAEVKLTPAGRLEKQLKMALLVAPPDTDLDFAKNEREWLTKYMQEAGIKLDVISSYEEIVYELNHGGFDLLHLITHGIQNDQNSLYSALKLTSGVEIRPDEVFGNFGNSNPVVILNACQTGIQGFSFTKIAGWSEKFIGSGCSAFIGTLWSVSDATAVKFTESLYKELKEGVPMGEAVRRARVGCKKFGDPSWLAYQLYTHPNLQVTFSADKT